MVIFRASVHETQSVIGCFSLWLSFLLCAIMQLTILLIRSVDVLNFDFGVQFADEVIRT